jgi:hypothetical protein
MGFFDRVRQFFAPAAAPAAQAKAPAPKDAQTAAADIVRANRQPDIPTRDGAAYPPRNQDFDTIGLSDPDEVLKNDIDGLGRLYANDHIAACLRRRYDKAASSTFSFHGEGANEAMVQPLTDLVLKATGLREMACGALDAITQGISYQSIVYWPQQIDAAGRLVQRIRKFVRHDKRRFRLLTVDRENVGLVDDGISTIGSAHYFIPKRRDLLILAVWQDDESRLGSGHGIGARLDRLAQEDEGIHRMELRTLEKFGGAIVDVMLDPAARDVDLTTILNVGKTIKSGDTTVWPAEVRDVKRTLLGEPVVKAFAAARANIRSQISKLVNGTDFANMGETGTYGLGAALAGEELALAQTDAEWLASHVIPQIAESVIALNPWIRALAPPGTPLPTCRAEVDVGRSPKETADMLGVVSRMGYEAPDDVVSEMLGVPGLELKWRNAMLLPMDAPASASPFGGAAPSAQSDDAEALKAINLVRRAMGASHLRGR